MKKNRRKFEAAFKAQVAIEALKTQTNLTELAERFKLHASQISTWKQELINKATSIFEGEGDKRKRDSIDPEVLYSKIGRLEVEKEILLKKLEKH